MDLVAELLADATVVKLNDGELRDIAQALDLPATDVAAFCAALAGRYGLHSVCVTLGADGCALWRDGEIATVPGRPVVVADAVGAGDAFCAILMRGLVAADRPLVQIADRANRLGAYVASHRGAVPAWPLDLIAE